MIKEEIADEFYEKRDDESEWGDPEPSQPKRRLNAMVSVRLSQEELAVVQERANSQNLSVSAYLRGLALRDSFVQTEAQTASLFRFAEIYRNEMVSGNSLPTVGGTSLSITEPQTTTWPKLPIAAA